MLFFSGKGRNRLGIGLAIVLALGSMYGVYSLFSQRNALRGEVAELNVKVVQLKNKYAEQKAMAEAMLRAKQAADSGSRVAESLKLENEKLQAEKLKGEQALAQHQAKHQEQMTELKERFAQQRSALEKLKEESGRAILEKDQKITALTGERDSLKASLTRETDQHARCKKNNAQLAALSTEVVKKYKNKGVLGSIAGGEPLTQIKKVEHEKLCQEYLDTIDKDTL